MLTTEQVLVSGEFRHVQVHLLASAELYNPLTVRSARFGGRSEHLTPVPRPACTVPTPPFPSGSAGGTGSPPVTPHPPGGLPVVLHFRR